MTNGPGKGCSVFGVLMMLCCVVLGLLACLSKSWYIVEVTNLQEFSTLSFGLVSLCKDELCDFYGANSNVDGLAAYSQGKCNRSASEIESRFTIFLVTALCGALCFIISFILQIGGAMKELQYLPHAISLPFTLTGLALALTCTCYFFTSFDTWIFCDPAGGTVSSGNTTWRGGTYCAVTDNPASTCGEAFGYSIICGWCACGTSFISLICSLITTSQRREHYRKPPTAMSQKQLVNSDHYAQADGDAADGGGVGGTTGGREQQTESPEEERAQQERAAAAAAQRILASRGEGGPPPQQQQVSNDPYHSQPQQQTQPQQQEETCPMKEQDENEKQDHQESGHSRGVDEGQPEENQNARGVEGGGGQTDAAGVRVVQDDGDYTSKKDEEDNQEQQQPNDRQQEPHQSVARSLTPQLESPAPEKQPHDEKTDPEPSPSDQTNTTGGVEPASSSAAKDEKKSDSATTITETNNSKKKNGVTRAKDSSGKLVDLPEGDDWAYDEEAGFYWSDDQGMFYDVDTSQFYDPDSGQWYDPETDTWYDPDEEEEAV